MARTCFDRVGRKAETNNIFCRPSLSVGIVAVQQGTMLSRSCFFDAVGGPSPETRSVQGRVFEAELC